MKLLRAKQFLKDETEIILLGLVVSTFFLKENMNSLFLIIYIVYWFIKKKYKLINKSTFKQIKIYLIFVLLYIFIIVIGIFYSNDLEKAIDFLLKQLLIIAFPVLILGITLERRQLIIFNSIFVSSVFLFVLFLYVSVAIKIIELNSLYLVDSNHPTWRYYLFTSGRLSPTIHPTYLSVFIAYSIFCIISFMKTEKQIFKGIFYFILFYFIITLLLLSSRGVIFSLLLVFFVHEMYLMIFKRNIYSFFKIAFVIIITGIVFSNTSVLHRISKIKNIINKDAIEIANMNNSSGKRAQIYLIAQTVVKDHFLFGVGTKNWKSINKYYYEKYYKKYFDYSILNLNTHNQYLNSMISWGVFGGVLVIGIVFFQIYFSFITNRLELSLFWCFFALVLFTENILDRHKGIVFFSIFSAYTIKLFLKKEKNKKTTTCIVP